MLIPYISFEKYLDLSSSVTDNVSLWPINICTIYFTTLVSESLDSMVSENFIMPKLQLLTFKETHLNALQFVRKAVYLSYKTLQ